MLAFGLGSLVLGGSYWFAFGLFVRHLSEQNLTSSQFFSHFFRQEKGRPQVTQILVGRWELFFWGMTKGYFLPEAGFIDFVEVRRSRY
jgi:hypothetical protein